MIGVLAEGKVARGSPNGKAQVMWIRSAAPVFAMWALQVSGAWADGNAERGKQLIKEWRCVNCHGETGNNRSTRFLPVPMLAGQPAAYLAKEMQNYASGVRPDTTKDELMKRFLIQLSAEQMEDIAAYYEAQKRY